jgi:hypothetical protein
MILLKLSRAFNGRVYYGDSWHDIGGYAKLAEDMCPTVDTEDKTS